MLKNDDLKVDGLDRIAGLERSPHPECAAAGAGNRQGSDRVGILLVPERAELERAAYSDSFEDCGKNDRHDQCWDKNEQHGGEKRPGDAGGSRFTGKTYADLAKIAAAFRADQLGETVDGIVAAAAGRR